MACLQYAIRCEDQTSILNSFALLDIRKELNAWLKGSQSTQLFEVYIFHELPTLQNMSLEMDTCGYLKAMGNHFMEQEYQVGNTSWPS